LIRRAQHGDIAAFQDLVDRYASLTGRAARALLADPAAAEDAVQEAWLDSWRGLARFDTGRPFRPWILTLVANRCRMQLRRRRLILVPLAAAYITPSGDNVEATILAAAGDADLRAALAALPAEHQQVLALRYYADLDLDEIAAVIGAPLGTVKSRLHRALRTLRGRLAPPLATGAVAGPFRPEGPLL
jgi:RNA polymerase sigma-70 factor (ECF subfamily)